MFREAQVSEASRTFNKLLQVLESEAGSVVAPCCTVYMHEVTFKNKM
jgi:hypothetical protein